MHHERHPTDTRRDRARRGTTAPASSTPGTALTSWWLRKTTARSGAKPRHDRASEFDSWDCVDELVAEEDYSQEWGEAASR